MTYVAWQVILALLIAYTVAAFVRHEGDKFVDGTDIKNSSNGTFFWVHTFNLGTLRVIACQKSLCLKELVVMYHCMLLLRPQKYKSKS